MAVDTSVGESITQMNDDQLAESVRALRAQGCTPKQIARALGVPATRVTALVRALAAERAVTDPHRLIGCWISPRWSGGLTVTDHPEWPDIDYGPSEPAGGLVSILVAREQRANRVEVCGYLVDTHCLGVKNTVGPRSMTANALQPFIADYFDAHGEPPLQVGLDLVQHLVFGAIAYARSIGFEPATDFDLVAGHLGPWTPPSAITFGRHGQPLYVQGPRDNATAVMATLTRTVGKGNFHYVLQFRQ